MGSRPFRSCPAVTTIAATGQVRGSKTAGSASTEPSSGLFHSLRICSIDGHQGTAMAYTLPAPCQLWSTRQAP